MTHTNSDSFKRFIDGQIERGVMDLSEAAAACLGAGLFCLYNGTRAEYAEYQELQIDYQDRAYIESMNQEAAA